MNNINVTRAQMAHVEELLATVKDGAVTALRSALADTARRGRTDISKRIGQYLNLPAREIKARVNIVKMPSKKSLVAQLSVSYRQVSLILFRARWSKRQGVTVTTVIEQGAQKFKHQFRLDFKGRAIYQTDRKAPKRVPSKGRYAGKTILRGPRKGQPIQRKPINLVPGPAPVSALQKSPTLLPDVIELLRHALHKRLLSKIDWMLSKKSPNVPDEESDNASD